MWFDVDKLTKLELLNLVYAVQECDATMLNIYSSAWPIKIILKWENLFSTIIAKVDGIIINLFLK